MGSVRPCGRRDRPWVSVGRTVGEISGKLDKFEGRPPGARFKVSREEEKLSFFQVLSSVISSFFGVQKNATRERDFKRGRARDFILVGLLLTVAFIFAVWGVVQLVMRLATP